MQVPLSTAAPQRVIWRQPLLWIVAGVFSVLLYTSNLSPSALMWTPARRDLAEAQPNALEIISKEAIAAQKAAQPKTPPTTVIPQSPEGQVFSWSVDGNKLVLGRSAGDGDMLHAVEGITDNVTWVAAGGHSLAVTASGQVWSWGRNDSRGGGGGGSEGIDDSGQLGAPRPGDRQLPAQIVGTGNGTSDTAFVHVAAGRYHSVALTQDGRIFTWGLNDFGQLGRTAATASSGASCTSGHDCKCPNLEPALASVPADGQRQPVFVRIAAGRYYTLAITKEGQLWTWGLNLCGMSQSLDLGKGLAPEQISKLYTPHQVKGGGIESAKVLAADAGYVHWAAITKRGEIYTCNAGDDGYGAQLEETRKAASGLRPPNAQGELGRSTKSLTATSLEPGRVVGLTANAIATGRCTTLAVGPAGTVFSWGCGNLARPGPADTPLPVPAFGANETAGRAVFVVSAEYTNVVITESGQVWAWGAVGQAQGGTSEVPVLVKGLPNDAVAAIASGAHQHLLFIVAKPGWPEVGKPGHVGPFIWDASPDIFNALTPFEPGLRNPCFHNRTTGALRCLPFFSIIGVSKCGTTDLYKKLLQHPSIMDSANKGPHFWDEDHTFDWYLDVYDPIAKATAANPQIVAGDASTNTFTYSGVGIRGKRNDDVILPAVIRAVQPTMKVIVMVREPVDRMYSAFWYYGCLYDVYKAFGMTEHGFDKYATESVEVVQACIKGGQTARDCALRHYEGKPQQLIKGLYSLFLPDWQAAYREDQLLIINTDTYRNAEEATIKEVLAFLQLEEATPDTLAAMAKVQANRGHSTTSKVKGCSGKRPHMLPKTRELLSSFYAAYDEELSQQLGWQDLSWNRQRGSSLA